MTRKTRKTDRMRRGGFTLLEILLVVGLLAVLAAFAIPAFVGQGERARIDLARAAVGPNGTMSQAVNLFRINTGVFPEELKDLIEKPGDDEIADKWTGPYLEDARMLNDPWGHEYGYEKEGTRNQGKFDLWSKGPDGIDGNEDDIGNWKDDR